MSDETRDPVKAAMALTRARLLVLRGQMTEAQRLEAETLELATIGEDLLPLARALALLSASLLSMLNSAGIDGLAFLNDAEAVVRSEGEEDAS